MAGGPSHPGMFSVDRLLADGLISSDWADVFRGSDALLSRIAAFLTGELESGLGYQPPFSDIFRAFQAPLADVRVLILGQDPYPTPSLPVGLAFSVAAGARPLTASLRNIFRELHDDLGVDIAEDGDLTGWQSQGVLLLNRVLTVRPGQPGSHRGQGWEQLTELAIRALADRRDRPLVAILWGRDAVGVAPFLTGVPIISSPHPSPLSAYRGFFGSKPFSRANALLASQGSPPIDWAATSPAW